MSRALVTATIEAENTWSGPLLLQGQFNISAQPGSGSTVTLQRRFGASGSWLDIETYTGNTEKQATELEDDVYYRLGVAAGDYSAACTVRLSQ